MARRCCITQFSWLVAFFFPLKISGGNFSSEIMQINNCFIPQVCVRRVMKYFGKLRKHSRTISCICRHLEELLRIFSSSPNLSRLNKPLLVHETNFLIAKSVVIFHFFYRSLQIGQPKTIDALGKGIERNAHTGVAFARFKAHKLSYLNITALGADYVHSSRDCGLTCINTPSCFSFNLAAVVDMNSKILCVLLPSDICNNSDKLVANRLFHYISIWVRIQ